MINPKSKAIQKPKKSSLIRGTDEDFDSDTGDQEYHQHLIDVT
jgi:hypothetical protein